MKTFALTAAIGAACLGLAACDYSDDEYNNAADYNAEGADYNAEGADYDANAAGYDAAGNASATTYFAPGARIDQEAQELDRHATLAYFWESIVDSYAVELLGPAAGAAVRLVDERLSTVSAQHALRAAGRSTRSQRPVVDQVAAVIILQHAIDTERASGVEPGRLLTRDEGSSPL